MNWLWEHDDKCSLKPPFWSPFLLVHISRLPLPYFPQAPNSQDLSWYFEFSDSTSANMNFCLAGEKGCQKQISFSLVCIQMLMINTLRSRQICHYIAFWNAFSWMKMYEFRLRFPWSLFLRLELTIFQYWFRQWLGTDQVPSHNLNQWWLVYRCIYVSLSLNELI